MKALTTGMPMREYLALRAVSAGVMRAMATDCQRAAWFASYLNPDPPDADDNDGSDRGTIAHEIFLEGSENCVQVFKLADYPNKKGGGFATGWTNDAIKEARDTARSTGKIPILSSAMDEVRAMVKATREFVASLERSEPAIWRAFQGEGHGPQGRKGGTSEAVILWNDDGVNCKARPDRISAEHDLIIHVKTTAGSANPQSWARTHLYGGDRHYLTAAWYRRACISAFDVDAAQVFLIVPQQRPYLPSLVGLPPEAIEMGAAEIDQAFNDWRRCVERDRWDGYPSRCLYVDPPVWMTMEREQRESLSIEQRLLLGSQP